MSPEILLNLVLFLPTVGAIVLALLPREQHSLIRNTAFWIAFANLVLSIALFTSFDASKNGDYQFVTAVPWIPQFNVQYKIGVDGISLLMIVLTTLLSAISILASFSS